MTMKHERVKVYVWEVPVRFTHWINAICLLALSLTGIYIGDPYTHAQSADQFIMGWIRFIHLTAAYALMMSIIIRIYWFIMGNNYSSISEWTRVSEIGNDLNCYLFFNKREQPRLGHSALGGLSYLILMLVLLFMIFSGFALHSVNHSGGIWYLLGGWMTNIMYLQTIRLWHHLLMYVAFSFVLIHLYIIVLSESMADRGLFNSIISGYKIFPERRDEVRGKSL
jgi:Ni/Fe-hydrogenase 1 B-type cytochrome subunit